MTVRVAPTVTISDEQRSTLEQWARGRSTPARLVLRARIVLKCAQGLENNVVADELGTDRLLVGKWRRRFLDKGRDMTKSCGRLLQQLKRPF